MDDTVQRVVRLLHKCFAKHFSIPELGEEITPELLAKHMAPTFVNGDPAAMNEKNYGKDGCMFIAQAIAYYGGYEIEDS